MPEASDAEAIRAGQYVRCAACAFPWLTLEQTWRMTFSCPEPKDSDDEAARRLLTEALGANWRWRDHAP
jgi:hypothetical protein